MQSFVSKGKNVKEAIQLGLDVMNMTMEDLNIEILQSETKGFMGIGAKSAIVKLSREPEYQDLKTTASHFNFEALEKEIDSLPDTLSSKTDHIYSDMDSDFTRKQSETNDTAGKAWVKDGKLYVKDSPNHYPTVTIEEGVHVYRNNKRVEERTTILSEKDKIKLEMQNEEQKTKWNVSMDNAKLHVVLEVIPGCTISRYLQDVSPEQHIKLIAEDKKEVVNNLEHGDVTERLEVLGVKQGFNQIEIEKALAATEKNTYEIATGKAAKPGKNGWVDLKVDIDAKNGLKEREGKMDFREIKTIPTVDRGKVIAVIHPAIPGEPGLTVTNEPLPAKHTHPVILKAGKGVMVVDDKIVATESGRPVIEQRGQLVKASILPRLKHNGNVGLSSGNIRFNGDIEIAGEVEENMVVEAGGDIMVHRAISMATVTASNAIIAQRNVVGSELSAGKNNMLVAELGHLLGIMYKQVEEMVTVINQLTKAAAFKSSDFNRGGLQPLIHILLEKRFKGFQSLAKKYVDVVRKGENYLDAEDWQQVGVSVTQIFLTLTNQITSLERLHDLSERMKKLYELSNMPIEPDSYITISSALDSSLYCSGDITIIGQGCINTKIHAGGRLKILGALRGGEVYGRLGIDIGEAGAESGTPTWITVPSDQTIRIKKAMEGTIIKIGNKKLILNEIKYHATAKLNQHQEIVFE